MANTLPRWKGYVHNNKKTCHDQISLYPLRFEPIYQHRLGAAGVWQICSPRRCPAMACIDFTRGAIRPVVPVVEDAKPVLRERLFEDEHFDLWRLHSESPFTVGIKGMPRVLVCIAGDGQVEHDGADYAVGIGDVLLLPAVVGACLCRPRGVISLLEISLPEGT